MKLQSTDNGVYKFFCDGCKCDHSIPTRGNQDHVWRFNGDMNVPTFNPSIRIYTTDEEKNECTICHFTITEGILHYCDDSIHGLKGQKIRFERY